MMEMTPNPTYLYFIIGYIIIIVGMGFYYSKKLKTVKISS